MLIPLAQDTVSNAFIFEEALKKEICEDLKYVQSLEKKVDEFETQKAKFLNEYDLLVQECLLNDIICTILRSFDDIDEYSEMACKYLEKVKECERFEMELSKSHKQKHDTSFAQLEKHCVNFEIALQNEKEKNLQDKTIANAEMRESWNKMKGRSVDTNFRKPSILGKPPLQTIRNQPVMRQPTAFKSERSQFSKTRFASQVVEKNALTKPVTPHSWPHEVKKKAQLQKDKDLNSKPCVITPARLTNTASGSKQKPRNTNQQTRNWLPSMSGRVTNKAVNIAKQPRNQTSFLKSKDLACPTCKKCIYTANHDA
ncbi:hypothetical protein Tco_0772363 [Tanacetum coccineum]|uniref:Uncharacterized protein n=1 Tax=Tanacetum coccineum TaxID=301880 RepID=A0ABQ4ZLC0_9ASTR